MRQLLPSPVDDVDPFEIYPSAPRPRPAGRPWLMLNMIASVDGAVAVDGVSAGLGGAGDREVFGAVRASADWVLVAAGTARAERYGRPRARAAGRAPGLAVLSGSLDLALDLPMLTAAADGARPLVLTGESPPADRLEALSEVAEVVSLPGARPHPRDVLGALSDRGAEVVLGEGGPTLNGQLVGAGLVDELCVSFSPLLVGGASSRIARGAGAAEAGPTPLRLEHLLEADHMLFARYVRR